MNLDTIKEFLSNNYIYFLGGAGILLIALIGLIVDGKKSKQKGEETINETSGLAANAPVTPVTPAAPVDVAVEPTTMASAPTVEENQESMTFEMPTSFGETPTAEENTTVVEEQPLSEEIRMTTPVEEVNTVQNIEVPVANEIPVVEAQAIPVAEEVPVAPAVEAAPAPEEVTLAPAPTIEVSPAVEQISVEPAPATEIPVVETVQEPATPIVSEPQVQVAEPISSEAITFESAPNETIIASESAPVQNENSPLV